MGAARGVQKTESQWNDHNFENLPVGFHLQLQENHSLMRHIYSDNKYDEYF